MGTNNSESKVESCVLVAEIDGSTYRFNVAPKDIETGIKTIKASYAYLKRDCTKVYISGFTLVSKSTNLSKEGLVRRIAASENLYRELRNNDEISLGF